MADVTLSGLPPDLQPALMELERKRAIAEAMMQRSMQPVQPAQSGTSIAARTSPLAYLAQIFQAYRGRDLQKEVQGDTGKLAGQYNTGLQGAVQAYMQQRGGAPAQNFPPTFPNDEEGNPMPSSTKDATLPNPMGAITSGMTSGYSPIRDLAKSDLAEQQKMQLTPKDLLGMKGLDPQSQVLAARLLSANIPMETVLRFLEPGRDVRTVGDHVVEVPRQQGLPPKSMGFFGTTTTPQGGPAAPGTPPGAPAAGGFLPTGQPPTPAATPTDFPLPPGARRQEGDPPGVFRMKGADGADDVYETQYRGDKLTGYKKLDNAPKVTVNNEVKFGNEWSKKQADLLSKKAEESHKAASDAAQDLGLLTSAAQAFNAGIKTGSFQELRNSIDRFAETAGFKSQDPKISNTDLFMRTMAERLLSHTKELRPMSDTDRQYLAEIKAGKNLDEKGMQRFLELAVETSIKSIHKHNNMLKEDYSGLEGTMPGFTNAYRVKGPWDQGDWSLKIGPDQPQPQGQLRPYGG